MATMKGINLIWLILAVGAYGQAPQVALYGYEQCADSLKVRPLPLFDMVKEGVSYRSDGASGILTLPTGGTYTLEMVWELVDSTELGKVYELPHADTVVRDTVALMSLYACMSGEAHPSFIGYCCCEKPCEGKQIRYYAHGGKWIEGNFKEGQALGQVRSYYPNGQVYQRATYFPRGNSQHRITYDPDGEVKSRENVFFYPIYRLINELENLGR